MVSHTNIMKGILISTIIILCCILNVRSGALHIFEKFKFKDDANSIGLYDVNDNVEILLKSNFNESIYGKDHAWLVEFYNSWCGFCRRFAPDWKALAADVHPWKPLVAVGAIDCAVEDNNDICRTFEIMGYPTIKYFHENYLYGPDNIGDPFVKGTNAEELRHLLAKKMIQEQTDGRGKSWPSIIPNNFERLTDSWNRTPSDVKITFLIFDADNATLPGEVILDLSVVSAIEVQHVSGLSKLVEVLKIERIPSLVAVNKDFSHTVLTPKEVSRAMLKKAILIFAKSKHVTITGEVGRFIDSANAEKPKSHNDTGTLPLKSSSPGDVIYQADFETGLRYTLSHEITKLKVVSGESLTALQNYLKVLVKYFPFTANGKKFVTELRDMVLGDRPEWSGEELEETIKNLEQDNLPVYSTLPEWVGCRGSAPHFRGFTCSLWSIFHMLTVNAAETKSSDPQEVLQAMHGYVKHFFGCEDCSKHFQAMSERNKLNSVGETDGAILWLWVAHNEVNHRLAGDSTEDPQHPKKQFPTLENCPKCRHEAGGWHINEVIKYVKKIYGVNQINMLGAIPHPSPASPVSTIDMALYAVLYLCSAILLFCVLRWFFTKKMYKKKRYIHDTFGKV